MKHLVYIISAFLILTGMYGGSVRAKDHNTDTSTKSSKKTNSEKVWCGTSRWTDYIILKDCNRVGGKVFSSYEDGERARLTKSEADSQLGYGDGTYCHDPKLKSFYRSGSSGCVGSDKIISKQEYTNKRLDSSSSFSSSSSTASSSGSNMWWCARITGVTYEDRNKCTTSGGDWFTSRHFAETEHNRLKGLSSTSSSSSSNLVWCASAKWFRYTEYSTCRDEDDGKSYLDKAQAKAEHERLKEVVKTAQTTCAPEVDKTYWESVRESKDADMLNAYLKKCPSGDYVELAKIKLSKLGSTDTPDSEPLIPNLDYGDYYALVIGNNRYDHLGDLRTAVNDATKVASVLTRDYGFEVDLLTNATESQIVKSLRNYRRNLSESDNLLIYYAGHGGFDEDANRTGYWLPVDATRDDPVIGS